jgi:hypothetical protein
MATRQRYAATAKDTRNGETAHAILFGENCMGNEARLLPSRTASQRCGTANSSTELKFAAAVSLPGNRQRDCEADRTAHRRERARAIAG